MTDRALLHARILALIDACADGSRHDELRDELLHDLTQYQLRTIPPYARFHSQRRVPATATGLDKIPAIPTDAFRFARLASHAATDDVRCFVSSGTTQDERSRHPFRDLTLYDRAARVAARYALFPDRERMLLVVLAPPEEALPESSLSYMLSRFMEWFGAPGSINVWRDDALDLHALSEVLVNAEMTGTPVALLGTSFGFVHAVDGLEGSRFQLPRASRIMQTGGFKGRSRELTPSAMRALLSDSFGVPEPYIVAEYGMTELSSQLYETTLRDAVLHNTVRSRHLWIPGWVRAVPVDPESLLPNFPSPSPVRERGPGGEVASGAAIPGLLRVDDPANLDSVSCIQTADLAYTEGDGIVVMGRAPGAIARGCSITADELLGKQHGKS